MIDRHQRRRCRHLQDPRCKVDEVHGWTTVTINNQLCFTFSSEGRSCFPQRAPTVTLQES